MRSLTLSRPRVHELRLIPKERPLTATTQAFSNDAYAIWRGCNRRPGYEPRLPLRSGHERAALKLYLDFVWGTADGCRRLWLRNIESNRSTSRRRTFARAPGISFLELYASIVACVFIAHPTRSIGRADIDPVVANDVLSNTPCEVRTTTTTTCLAAAAGCMLITPTDICDQISHPVIKGHCETEVPLTFNPLGL